MLTNNPKSKHYYFQISGSSILSIGCSIRCNRYFLFLFALLSSKLATGQTESLNHAGKDFWFTGSSINGIAGFILHGPKHTTVTFHFNSISTIRTVLLTDTVQVITMTPTEKASLVTTLPETPQDKSIHITTDSVCIIQSTAGDDDGTLLYPSDDQRYGDLYYFNGFPSIPAIAYNPNFNPSGSGDCYLVSRCDSIVLEIVPSQQTIYHVAGIPFQVMLRRGQTYKLCRGQGSTDLSGTRVKVLFASCCNPINLFFYQGGNNVGWPINFSYCCSNALEDQVLPVSTWDTLYPVVRFLNNRYAIFSIVSAFNNNTVFFDGVPVRNMNAGDSYDTIISKAAIVSALKPISIMQHMLSYSATITTNGGFNPVDSSSDPSSLWLLPMKNGLTETYFKPIASMPNSVQPYNYLPVYPNFNLITIIARTTAVNTIILDNTYIAAQFNTFPNNAAYSYASFKIDTNVHHLKAAERVLAYYYAASGQSGIVWGLGDVHPSDFVTASLVSSDTAYQCMGDTVHLFAGQAQTYQWSDGSTGQSLSVTDTGLYRVVLRFNDSCNMGSMKYFRVLAKSYVQEEQIDTVYKCLHEALVLSGNMQATRYLWNDGTTGRNFTAFNWDSTYTVLETFQTSCRQVKHHYIVLRDKTAALPFYLGPDTAICPGMQLILHSSNLLTRWSDSSKGMKLIVDKPGVYWAVIEDTCSSTQISDTIRVGNCLDRFCNLVFPTAFTPNDDGKNDIFRPVAYGNFSVYTLIVYNRWGQKVFQSTKSEQGWDGVDHNKPADMGTYFYRCSYICPLKGAVSMHGDFTLVR